MKIFRSITGILSILILGSYLAVAQNSIETSRGDKTSETIEIAQMASDLVKYGQKNEDPYTLVAAAKMLMQFNVEDAGDERVDIGEGKTDAPDDAAKGGGMKPIELNASTILDQAEIYADRNTSIMRVIMDLKNQADAGARGYTHGQGYIKVYETIPAYGSRDFTWTFDGEEFAEILFVGEDETDIDVYVYDSATEKLLSSDEGNKSGAYFSWTPPDTKKYMFRVVNKGKYDNTTYILSN